jgi:predicted RNase H-like nuclease (RuvC/YqgF family)
MLTSSVARAPTLARADARRSHRSMSASARAPTRARASSPRARAYAGGMPGPSKDDAPDEVTALKARIADLERDLATERTAKSMLENQLRAAVSEVSKILAAKRELEMRLRDEREGSAR